MIKRILFKIRVSYLYRRWFLWDKYAIDYKNLMPQIKKVHPMTLADQLPSVEPLEGYEPKYCKIRYK